MVDVNGYNIPERRAHSRFPVTFPAFLRLSVIGEGSPTVLELEGETVEVSLDGVRVSVPGKPEIASFIKDTEEGRAVDAEVEVVTEEKRIKAGGNARWFKVEAQGEVTVGIHLKWMERDERETEEWEDLVKSVALSL